MLFELITGRMPFEGTTPTEIIDHILHQDPPPRVALHLRRPGLRSTPSSSARSRRRRTFRYQSAREIYNDLKNVARRARRRAAPDVADQPPRRRAPIMGCCVAVMTFSNITREPADDWIGTGIAETVSSDLKNIHSLSVIGRARVYDALRNLSTDAHLNDSLAIDIGRRLGATWVVVGGYQRLGVDDPHHREFRRGARPARCSARSRWTARSTTSSRCRTRSSTS